MRLFLKIVKRNPLILNEIDIMNLLYVMVIKLSLKTALNLPLMAIVNHCLSFKKNIKKQYINLVNNIISRRTSI
jgi:hypothetical protein